MRKNEKSWNFDNSADRYDEIVKANSMLYERYDDVLDTVVEISNVSLGKRVLDIGTGTGNLALRCLARGAEVIGLDPSEKMLAKAKEKVEDNPKARFLRVDEPFLNIPYPNAYFDAVISTYAFHHVPHHRKSIGIHEMVRVLKLGGSWVLGDLAFENAQEEEKALHKFEWLEEEYFSRIEDLRPVFVELGMELATRQFTPVTWILWSIKSN